MYCNIQTDLDGFHLNSIGTQPLKEKINTFSPDICGIIHSKCQQTQTLFLSFDVKSKDNFDRNYHFIIFDNQPVFSLLFCFTRFIASTVNHFRCKILQLFSFPPGDCACWQVLRNFWQRITLHRFAPTVGCLLAQGSQSQSIM